MIAHGGAARAGPRRAAPSTAGARRPSLSHEMATIEQLGPVPPITVELEPFDYVALDSPREPPPLELRARLARSYDAGDDDQGLRLAFVAGRPVDSHDVLVVSYVWRPSPEGVAWGVERWPSPERRLRPYRHDATFEPRAAADVHAELRSLGLAGFPGHVRACLAG
jgi:hypothetical protein